MSLLHRSNAGSGCLLSRKPNARSISRTSRTHKLDGRGGACRPYDIGLPFFKTVTVLVQN